MMEKWWASVSGKAGVDIVDAYVNRMLDEFWCLGSDNEKEKQTNPASSSPPAGDEKG